MANTLFLRLESPLQSWGEDSQWSERRTAPEPTKSGIVGLLACALGWNDDERIHDLSLRVRIGVRCDVRGTSAPLKDYHTVGGGYGDNNPQLLNAKGELKISSGKAHTEPTSRYYLCDASFLVVLQSDADTIAQLTHAVQFPAWQLYLGRKSCVPTVPPFDGVGDYTNLEEALQMHPARFITNEREVDKRPRIVIECDARLAGAVRHRDQIASRAYRLFEPHYSRESRVPNEIRVEILDEGA